MKTHFHTISILFFGFLIVSCDKDETVIEPTETHVDCDESEELHECVTYDPSNFSDHLVDNWSVPNEKDSLFNLLVTPDEPGGGIFTVTLSTSLPTTPSFFIDDEFSVGGSITGGAQVDENSESLTASFTAHPGMEYSIRMHPFFNGNIDDFPIDYDLSWSYQGRMDCYEPNDIIEDAKSIPKGELIEAYCLAGYQDYFVGSLDDNTYDWYKFELTEASKMKATLLETPSDADISFRFFNEDELNILSQEVIISGNSNEPGALIEATTNLSLSPGTYYLEVHTWLPQSSRAYVHEDDERPDHLDTQYKLRLDAID